MTPQTNQILTFEKLKPAHFGQFYLKNDHTAVEMSA